MVSNGGNFLPLDSTLLVHNDAMHLVLWFICRLAAISARLQGIQMKLGQTVLKSVT